MFTSLKFTLAVVFFLLLALVAIATLVFFLRKLTLAYAKGEYIPDDDYIGASNAEIICKAFADAEVDKAFADEEVDEATIIKKHWWRFAVPALVAVLLAVWLHLGGPLWYLWPYLVLACIGVPMAVSFFLLREVLEKKKERLMMLAALLLLLNAALFGCQWYVVHLAHTKEIDSGKFYHPHASTRNYFLIPLWVVTILFGWVAYHAWRKENRTENRYLLPDYAAAHHAWRKEYRRRKENRKQDDELLPDNSPQTQTDNSKDPALDNPNEINSSPGDRSPVEKAGAAIREMERILFFTDLTH